MKMKKASLFVQRRINKHKNHLNHDNDDANNASASVKGTNNDNNNESNHVFPPIEVDYNSIHTTIGTYPHGHDTIKQVLSNDEYVSSSRRLNVHLSDDNYDLMDANNHDSSFSILSSQTPNSNNNNDNNPNVTTTSSSSPPPLSSNKKSLFTSVQLRRLEELKRYQQYNNHIKDNPFYNHQPYGHILSPTAKTVDSFTLSPSSNHTIPLSPQECTTTSSIGTGGVIVSSPLNINSTTYTSYYSSMISSFSWENTRFQYIENEILSFIQDSSLRISIMIIMLLLLLHTLLSSFTTTTSTSSSLSSTSTTNSSSTMILTKIYQIVFELFITNMKLFSFIICYAMILDLIFISALDNVHIPLLREDHVIRSIDDDDNTKTRKNNSIPTSFMDLPPPIPSTPGSPPPSSLPLSPKSKVKQPNRPHHNKNTIIRQYAIEYIRKITTFISLGLTSIGLSTGLFYLIVDCVSYVMTHGNDFYHVIQSGLTTTFMNNDDNYYHHHNHPSFSTLVEIVYWMEYWIMKVPFTFVCSVYNSIIRPLSKLFGISYIIRQMKDITTQSFISKMNNKYFISDNEYNHVTFCIHCINVIKHWMMYIGMFMLVFYLILVYCYPIKKREEGKSKKEE